MRQPCWAAGIHAISYAANPSRLCIDNRAGQIPVHLAGAGRRGRAGKCDARGAIFAGYSIGELAAWGAGGLLDASVTLDLAARRAEAMDAATHAGDGLIFVRGLSREEVGRLCERHGAAIAIVNPGDAFVIGGGREALGRLAEDARAMHAARIVALPVEVASHTKRLAAASAVFRETLHLASVVFPPRSGARILSGIDAAPVVSLETGLDKLAAQISQTVQWADCLQACVEAGATGFLELGPGHALSGMAVEIGSGLPARSLDDFRSLQGVRAWLVRHLNG